jgi:ribosomal protein L1
MIGDDAGKVNIRRGHVTISHGQLVENRAAAIRALESQKELETVNLKAGI